MRSAVKRKLAFFLLLVSVLLAGCATLRGMAEDTQNLGRGLKKTVAEEEGGSRRQAR